MHSLRNCITSVTSQRYYTDAISLMLGFLEE
jgi:hypothetical protein